MTIRQGVNKTVEAQVTLEWMAAGRGMPLVIAATIARGTRRLPKIMSLLVILTTCVDHLGPSVQGLPAQLYEDHYAPPYEKK
jgi:hypothetical protein